MSEPLLRARGLRIEATSGERRRTLLSGVDLDVHPGETVGIVGESGSGKSLTARALIGLPPPGIAVSGELRYRDRSLLDLRERELAKLRGSEIGLVLQDPFTSLNPLRRVGRHLDETLRDERGRRLGRQARRTEAQRRLAEVGITAPDAVDRYPFELSGGMRQRVAIAATLARNPALLIADEPSTALDTVVQEEILQLLAGVQRERNMALVLITHDLRIAFSMCDRVYVFYAGQVLETGPSAGLARRPRHPYTHGLLASDPPIDRAVARLAGMDGSVPPAEDVLDTCAFLARCRWATEQCATPMTLRPAGADRQSACVRIGDIEAELLPSAASPVRAAPPAAPDGPALVRVSGLRKDFHVGHGRVLSALDGVDIAVAAGESVGVVGASGSGKTTLARCLVGLETPTAGRIDIAGVDATDYARVRPADLRRLRGTVQYVFQDPYSSLNPARTVGAALAEAIVIHHGRGADVRSRVGALLERVGLPAGYASYKPVLLSGGERQRVAIARALAVEPQLIVCDEPVSALDVSVQAHILNLLRDLREQTGVGYLFITHDLAVVRQVVDRLYVLYHGQVVEQGGAAEILDAPQHEYTQRLRAAVPSLPDTPSPAGAR